MNKQSEYLITYKKQNGLECNETVYAFDIEEALETANRLMSRSESLWCTEIVAIKRI